MALLIPYSHYYWVGGPPKVFLFFWGRGRHIGFTYLGNRRTFIFLGFLFRVSKVKV